MKHVLTLATTGLFVTGLALLPMSARADQTVTGSESVTPGASTMTPGKTTATSGVQSSTTAVKKDDKKVTATPGGTVPATGAATVKTPGKGPS
jgi:hypothetical protein